MVEKDQELQKNSPGSGPEEACALAASLQGGFTKEGFVTEMQGLYADLTMDLTDEDMLKVAGGDDRASYSPYTYDSCGAAM